MPQRKRRKGKLVRKRPAETAGGFASALAVYGFCTQIGAPPAVAIVLALVVGVVPFVVSAVVDALGSRA